MTKNVPLHKMAKGRPILLRPGFLANDVVPDYERLRNEHIKRNNERCKQHGVKTIATSVVSPVQAERANESGKRNRGELDDGDYRPSEDENDNDYDHELDDSFEEEVSNMGPGLRTTQSNPDQQRGSSMISERATRSTPQPDMDTDTQDMHTQALPSAQPQSEPLAENDVALKVGKGRGPTRGKMAQRLIDKDGRLRVPIPPQFCAPIGEHATKMASKIGYEVRTNVIDLGVRRWKAIDDTVKAPILQRLTDKFDLQGDPMDVDKVVATQCGRRMSDFTFRLHKKYKKLLETKGPEYARSNPPRNVKLEQWTSLIDKKWNDKRWQAQSLVNTNNRASEKHLKHRCGSKSLSVRVAAAMKDGVMPPLKEIYQSTHYNKDTNEWISPGCKDKFDEMEKIEAEHNSQEGAVPMTQEDLSIKVFKKRSGYIKGLGMRPSSSVRIYVNSYEYVTNLEKKVQERDEIIQEHVEKIEAANATIVELVEAKEQANATIANLVEAKEQQGRTLASVLEFLKKQGYTGVS